MARALFLLLALLGFAVAEVRSNEQETEQPPGEEPVTPEEIEELRREIERGTRSSLEVLFDWNGDSGDLNNQLHVQRYGVRYNLKRESSTIEMRAWRVIYGTIDSVVEESGTGGAVAVRTKHSDRLESHFEIGALWLSSDTWLLTGLATLTVKPSEKAHYSVSFVRANVDESVLSAVGLRPVTGPFAEELVGAVLDNRVSVSGWHGLPARFDVYGEAAVGGRTGENAGTNEFARVAGGVGWNAVESRRAQLRSLRLSVFGDYFGFSEDRLGYGGASLLDENGQPIPLDALGSDGISPNPSEENAGVGGYFSPARYTMVLGRIDARIRTRGSIQYELSGFLGRQSFTGASSRPARGLSFTLRLDPNGRLSVPVTFAWDNFGPFNQRTFRAHLVIFL